MILLVNYYYFQCGAGVGVGYNVNIAWNGGLGKLLFHETSIGVRFV